MNKKTETRAAKTARKIRAAYKKKGWSAKDISVRVSYPGYEQAIDIRVKNPDITEADAREVAEPYESIRYDERSGEILQGGNLMISVRLDYEAEEEGQRLLIPTAKRITEELEKDVAYDLADGFYIVVSDRYPDFKYELCSDRYPGCYGNLRAETLEELAAALLCCFGLAKALELQPVKRLARA